MTTTTTEVEFTEPCALYRLYDASGTLLYAGIARNLSQRMSAHADQPWWPLVARKTMVWYGTQLAAREAEAIVISEEEPLHNVVRPAVGDKVPPHGQRRGWNRKPLMGWHAPPELAEWVRAEAERRGVTVTTILNEAIQAAKTRSEGDGGVRRIIGSMHGEEHVR